MERELFTIIKDALDSIPQASARPSKCQYTDRDILLTTVWATLHDRPVDWACKRCNWPWHDRTRPLPSGATVSRRARSEAVATLRAQLLTELRVDAFDRALLLDAKALPVSGHSSDRDAKAGYYSSGIARGFKLHMIADSAGNPLAFDVAPLNVHETTMARVLLDRVPPKPGATLLADGAYDCNDLYDAAWTKGVQMIAAPRRKNAQTIGHRRHSPRRLIAIHIRAIDPSVLAPRRRIESHFGTMGNVVGGLSPLPNHVRGLRRVKQWVTLKLVVDAAHRRRRRQRATA
jgi:hypothetical protein